MSDLENWIDLDSDELEAEFRVATKEALDKNVDTFEFHEQIVDTFTAIQVVKELDKYRTVH